MSQHYPLFFYKTPNWPLVSKNFTRGESGSEGWTDPILDSPTLKNPTFVFWTVRNDPAFLMHVSHKSIQQHLGHSSLAMTQRYSHLSRNFQKQEVQKLNSLCDESSKNLVRNAQIVDVEVQSNVQAIA
jgi:hypothetical protein